MGEYDISVLNDRLERFERELDLINSSMADLFARITELERLHKGVSFHKFCIEHPLTREIVEMSGGSGG